MRFHGLQKQFSSLVLLLFTDGFWPCCKNYSTWENLYKKKKFLWSLSICKEVLVKTSNWFDFFFFTFVFVKATYSAIRCSAIAFSIFICVLLFFIALCWVLFITKVLAAVTVVLQRTGFWGCLSLTASPRHFCVDVALQVLWCKVLVKQPELTADCLLTQFMP